MRQSALDGHQGDGDGRQREIVVASPGYFPELCDVKGKVIRAIAILNEPVEHGQPAGELVPGDLPRRLDRPKE